MKTRELLNYAKDNGYNSVKFICKEKCFAGQFLDAYYEFVKIPLVGEDSFVTIGQLEEIFGYDLEFEIPEDDEQWLAVVRTSFIMRGREIPKKYAFNIKED